MKTHEITANPDNVHWGFFDYRLKPVLTVRSGDRLIANTLSGHPDLLPKDRRRIPPELTAIHATVQKGAGPHILLGPINVEGAKPGNVLEVHIGTTLLRNPLDSIAVGGKDRPVPTNRPPVA